MAIPHKRNASVIPDAIMAEMLTALPAKPLGARRQAAIRKTLLQRIGSTLADEAPLDTGLTHLTVRAESGNWISFAPNVDMKTLHDDGSTRSWLARFGPGGRIPAHIQTGDEEAIVLTGWCYLDDEKMCTGDYHRIGTGARHGNIVSPEGCLIFVRSHSAKRHASELIATR